MVQPAVGPVCTARLYLQLLCIAMMYCQITAGVLLTLCTDCSQVSNAASALSTSGGSDRSHLLATDRLTELKRSYISYDRAADYQLYIQAPPKKGATQSQEMNRHVIRDTTNMATVDTLSNSSVEHHFRFHRITVGHERQTPIVAMTSYNIIRPPAYVPPSTIMTSAISGSSTNTPISGTGLEGPMTHHTGNISKDSLPDGVGREIQSATYKRPVSLLHFSDHHNHVVYNPGPDHERVPAEGSVAREASPTDAIQDGTADRAREEEGMFTKKKLRMGRGKKSMKERRGHRGHDKDLSRYDTFQKQRLYLVRWLSRLTRHSSTGHHPNHN